MWWGMIQSQADTTRFDIGNGINIIFWALHIWGQTQTKASVHYTDFIMGASASQITSLTIVHLTVYSDTDQRKHQSSASLAFVRGIHREPVNSPHKWPVSRKIIPFHDVIMARHLAIRTKGPRYGFCGIRLPFNLTEVSALLAHRRLSKFIALHAFIHQTFQFRYYPKSHDDVCYRLVHTCKCITWILWDRMI